MKIRIALGLALLTACVAFWPWPAKTVQSGNQINWYSYDEGRSLARLDGKGMVFYFYADWCTYCVRMEEETFAHDSVVDFMNNQVVAVKVDVDDDKKLARSFGVRGLPATVMITRSGDRVGPLPGFIKPKQYLAMLTRILEQS